MIYSELKILIDKPLVYGNLTTANSGDIQLVLKFNFMNKEWIPPQLYNAGGDLSKNWFVYYYLNGKRIRVYGRINRITTKKGRNRVAQELIDEIIKKQKLAFKK